MPSSDFHRRRLKQREREFVEGLNVGEFAGRFSLQWIGPDLFQYTPDPDDPFRYLRNKGPGKRAEVVQPGSMVTDGGSIPRIPRIAQILPGLSPWEYGPAYLIHDWEFYRHDIDPDFRKSFKQVNLTLAEAIWTLMNAGYPGTKRPARNVQTVYTIYSAVSSPIGRQIWDAPA